jgi:hypothetical protein
MQGGHGKWSIPHHKNGECKCYENSHTIGRSLTGEGGQKKYVKKVNMVDVLPTEE